MILATTHKLLFTVPVVTSGEPPNINVHKFLYNTPAALTLYLRVRVNSGFIFDLLLLNNI